MTSEARRAYAALGLRPGASVPEIRRRYRALAQRWHPDRHASDPRNQAEANEQMRRFNEAVRVLTARPDGLEGVSTGNPAGSPLHPPGRRLSRNEVDGLVNAIGREGPVEWLLDGMGWVGSTVEGVFAFVGALILVIRWATLLAKGEVSLILTDRHFLYFVAVLPLLVVVAIREILERRRLSRHRATE